MLNEKIDKLISELDTAAGMLIAASMNNRKVYDAMEKISRVSLELGNLIDYIEAEKAIDNCRLKIFQMEDDEIGDCGTDENGKCIGYASDGGEPCEECRTCAYSAFEEEEI